MLLKNYHRSSLIMSNENTSAVGEKPASTETGLEVNENNVVKPEGEAKPSEEVETAEAEAESTEEAAEDEELDKKDPKVTFKKLRKERDSQERLAKEAQKALDVSQSKLVELEKKLLSKEEADAIAEGNFEKLYKDKASQLTEVETNFDNLVTEKSDLEKTYNEKLEASDESINDMVDLLIEEWPDTGKSAIDSKKETSAADRLKQYKKALPLVKVALNKTDATSGISNTPDHSNGNGGTNETVKTYNKLLTAGIYK